MKFPFNIYLLQRRGVRYDVLLIHTRESFLEYITIKGLKTNVCGIINYSECNLFRRVSSST